MERVYLCIDLKTFYASVECVERGLDPFSTNLVVADEERGKGTICLAISPKMKALGVRNRCRLFEIPQNISYIIAKPRMKKYIEYSANIYKTYLKYVSKEDIHVYSIDEAFIDITHYLNLYNMKSMEFVKMILKDIYNTFGITATCGIGTNLYLAKVALDILSKHTSTNIGWLTEEKYRSELWHYRPISDFWQIGRGIEKRLKKYGIYDMCDLANANPKLLYKEFGVNAEFLIDHAWGKESCTMADIKEYKPKSNSVSNSQILFEDYSFEKARTILKEMVESKSIEMVERNLVTDTVQLCIGYSKNIRPHSGGTGKLSFQTNIYSELLKCFLEVYDKTTDRNAPIRRIGIGFENVEEQDYEQINLLVDTEKIRKEQKLEATIGHVKGKLGKNSILRGTNFEEGATAMLRNKLIGGHNSE